MGTSAASPPAPPALVLTPGGQQRTAQWRRQNSRARVGRLVALEGMREVVLVLHVALRAQVEVEADEALPAHAPQPMLLAAVTDDVGVPDA